MNGISFPKINSEEQTSTFLDQVKKNEDANRKKNIKWISIILLSNLFVFTLTYSPANEPVILKDDAKFLIHPNFQLMTLNINPLVETEKNVSEKKITLINSKNKIIIPIAYLHEEIKIEGEQNIRRFKIEIPDSEITKIASLLDEKLIAVPFNQKIAPIKVHRGSNYEISFFNLE